LDFTEVLGTQRAWNLGGAVPSGPNSSTEDEETGLQVRWADPADFECTYGKKCWGLFVEPSKDCLGGVYVEINIFSKDGNVIDWTNGSVPSLAQGQQALMVFKTYESKGASAKVASTSCYER
jgi:hypothetical protein